MEMLPLETDMERAHVIHWSIPGRVHDIQGLINTLAGSLLMKSFEGTAWRKRNNFTLKN